MKTLIALTFTITGAVLLMAPLLFTAALGLADKHLNVGMDDRTTCYFAGAVLLAAGIVFAIFAFRASDKKGP